MTPKAEFFEMIEDYCLGQLSEIEKHEFESELGRNSELKDEVNLQLEIQSAITETDVIDLREKLESVAGPLKSEGGEEEFFKLLDDFTNIEEIKDNISPEELINYYDSLPKVHVYQRELVSNENIHQFYKEQSKAEVNDKDNSLNEIDVDNFEEFEGLEEAILEKDILDLRETLSQVAKSVKPQYSTKEIDKYLDGELTGDELELFEVELEQNHSLEEEIELHEELKDAVMEKDILDLRGQLSDIMRTETSWSVSEQSIEDFIDEVLEGELLKEFNAEYSENTDLMAEVSLRKNVNNAIGEKDIFKLRDRLQKAREDVSDTEIKSLVPQAGLKIMNNLKQKVAIIILLIGLGGILSIGLNSPDKTYRQFYNSPEWAPERSVTTSIGYLQKANMYYSNRDYENAITVLDQGLQAESEKFVFHFYKGASFQNMNKLNDAIAEYNEVLRQGDNLYIEEAEWNRSLCYLKLGEKDIAKTQFEAIIDRKGFYEKVAKAVLRRLKFSLE
ncbi:MAG: hypothetical protein J7L95_07605 [Prolixibacteraceae bacterium]|nr:hypothetical protein [Prolixibacteraceae bacterium]